MSPHQLTHDWNHDASAKARPVTLLADDTLRDGLQSPSVTTPTVEEKIEILARMDALGIDTVDIGLPGASSKAEKEVERLARAMAAGRMKLHANCAARAIPSDIKAIAEIAQRAGVAIECGVFAGAGPIRQFAEGSSLDDLRRRTDDAVKGAVKEGLSVTYVSEDTTRSTPDSLRLIIAAAVHAGATRLCVTDSVGCATPFGAVAVVDFVNALVHELGAAVGIDWHGHGDRGLALAASLAAFEAGATRLHGAALGIGERGGNTPLDLLLVNLVMMGYRTQDLTGLGAYCETVSHACEVPIPRNYPVIGSDAFVTSTGMHAAAFVKALRNGDRALMDSVFAAVPADLVGRKPDIEIGPTSAKANVVFWLESRGLPAKADVVDRIYAVAKASSRTLTHDQIQSILERKI